MIKLQRSFLYLYIGLGLCVGFFCYFFFQSLFFIPHDFSNSYFGAHFFLKGEFNAGIFDPYQFNKKIYDEGFRQVFASYNPNPPFTALFFSAFAWLQLEISKAVFNVISFFFFLISLYRLCKYTVTEPSWILMVVPVVFFIPIRNQVLFGQTYFLLCGLLTEGYLAFAQKREWPMAVFWGLAILLKVFPVVVFLFLVLRKAWQPAMKLVAVCVALLLSSILLQGVDVWSIYLHDVLPAHSRGEISGAYIVNYQSALMFFKCAFVGDPQLNPLPWLNSVVLFRLSLVVFNAAWLACCVRLVVREASLFSFSMLLFTGILLSPYGSTYTYILLIPLMVSACATLDKKYWIWIAGILFMISNLPLSFFEGFPKVWQFPRLALSVGLFAVLIFVSHLKFDWRIFSALVVLFSIPGMMRPAEGEDASIPLIAGGTHSLIFDYGVGNGVLYYKYWDEQGGNIRQTQVPAQSIAEDPLRIVDNQIEYKGRQITHTPDRKLKPSLLDGNRLIYLSDKNRGMGFYNLRVIDLNNSMK